MSDTWKIDRLAHIVAEALGTAAYEGQRSARVRDVPDKRTIRYYTTLGILDRPLEMRGRVAYYGRRHVMQIVAIKRLQAKGLPLVEVQQVLAAADDGKLSRLADLPGSFWDGVASPAASTASAATIAEPGEAVEPCLVDRDGFWAYTPEAPAISAPRATEIQRPVAAVDWTLSPGVRLVIEGVSPGDWTEEAVARLGPAVESLMEALRRLGLVPPGEPGRKERGPEENSEEDSDENQREGGFP
ncbi:MAG: helix-turn-helix domain-containing protein [Planctomycetota bacterium]|jgi:DNA-binding transcriptional MerR regulator